MLYRLEYQAFGPFDLPEEPGRRFEEVVEAHTVRAGRVPVAVIEHARNVARQYLRGSTPWAVELVVEVALFRPASLVRGREEVARSSVLEEMCYTSAVLDRIEGVEAPALRPVPRRRRLAVAVLVELEEGTDVDVDRISVRDGAGRRCGVELVEVHPDPAAVFAGNV